VSGKIIDDTLHALEPISGRLQGQAADAEIAGHHPLPGQIFENLQDFFALAEGVKENGHRAQVDGVRAQPNQMRSATRQFRQQHANVLRALGNFDPQDFLDREAVTEIIRKRREIVDSVG
jgi:hypothetical protein